MDTFFYTVGAIVLSYLVLRRFIGRVTVFEFERGLHYRRGRFRRVLEPGQYWMIPLRSTIDKVDVRLRSVTVPGQEVLSSDSVTLKLSLAAQYEVSDPKTAHLRVESFADALYMELQLALRNIVGDATADELVEGRNELSKKLLEATQAKAQQLGLKLSLVSIKDIMFPGELKKMFAQVVKARKEGLAALERARGEQAALRQLANAARMLENNPTLMQLRTLQTLGEGSGHTMVFGLPDAGPLSLRPKDGAGGANGNGNGAQS